VHNSKIMPKDEGPFDTLERIDNNAYKINFSEDYGLFAMFNSIDLASHL